MNSVKKNLFVSSFLSITLGATSHALVLDVDLTDSSDVLSSFNAVVLNDFETSSEVEGRILVVNDVGGNQISNIAFDTGSLPSTTPTFIVGGTVNTSGNIQVQQGGVLLKNPTSANIQNAPGGVTVDPNLIVSPVVNTMLNLSAGLSGLTDNSSYSFNGGSITVNVFAATNGVAVVSIDGSDLSAAQNLFTYNGLTNVDALIVNVTGNVTSLRANTNDNSASTKVVFNFEGEQDFTTIGTIKGSILAPESAITNNGSFIEGTVVAYDLDMKSQELHTPVLSTAAADAIEPFAVPEPSQYGLIFGCLVFAGAILRRGNFTRL